MALAANAAPDPKLPQVTDCPLEFRSFWLSRGLRMGESDFAFVLYHYLVQEFRDHPNKKRAIFIYERCVFHDEGIGHIGDAADLNKIDLSLNYGTFGVRNKLDGLKDNYEQCKAQRAKYVSAAWFGWMTDAAAVKPPCWLFDDVTTNVIDKHMPQGFLGQIGSGGGMINDQNSYDHAKRNLPALKQEIKAVGFDTKRLGLDDITLT